MLYQIGGLGKVLVFIGALFANSISNKIFKNEILSKLYHVNSEEDDAQKIHPMPAEYENFYLLGN